ncbi:MAG: hypothetical protein ACREDR_32755, partial [Blastocatellia bacterium]
VEGLRAIIPSVRSQDVFNLWYPVSVIPGSEIMIIKRFPILEIGCYRKFVIEFARQVHKLERIETCATSVRTMLGLRLFPQTLPGARSHGKMAKGGANEV